MLGPFATASRRYIAMSPRVGSRTPAVAIAQTACDVHDNNNNNNINNDNDNA